MHREKVAAESVADLLRLLLSFMREISSVTYKLSGE